MVEGMLHGGRREQYKMYAYCMNYFYDNYGGVFFADSDAAEEIFENAFIKFWENMESRKIYVEDGLVRGKDGEPLRGSVRTYFMGIAKIKYKEFVRQQPVRLGLDDFPSQIEPEELYDQTQDSLRDIIADLLSQMSATCYEILRKFYYEGKKLDVILQEIPSISTVNSLKTRKYKCMEKLRQKAEEIRASVNS